MITAEVTLGTAKNTIVIDSVYLYKSGWPGMDLEFHSPDNPTKEFRYPIILSHSPDANPYKFTVDNTTYVLDTVKNLELFYHDISTLLTLDNL